MRMLLSALKDAVRCKISEHIKVLVIQKRQTIGAAPKYYPTMANTSAESTWQRNNKPILRREKQQQSNMNKTTPFTPGTVILQILGAGSNGAPASVYLFTDQSRYLFNCGEGTQRLAHEHKTKLSKLEQIFVTRNTWETIGGFPGLALTLQDTGVKDLTLHGPPYLENILFSMKRFVVLKSLQLKTVDCTQIQDFEDNVMSVKSVPLYRITNKKKAQNFMPDASCNEQIAIQYICKLKPRPGALDLEKCVDYGVPPGPLLGLLKNGIDVTLDDGTIVSSKDVSYPSEGPLSFMFIDIPSLEFLKNLEEHKEILVNSKLNSDNSPEMCLVIHFSPQEVVNNNLYRTFVEQFSPKTQHIYLKCKQNKFSGYTASHRIQYHLNLVNPAIFPLLTEAYHLTTNLSNKLKKTKLEDDHITAAEEQHTISEHKNSDCDNHLTDLNPRTFYHLRPKKGLDRTLEAKLSPSEYIQETQVLKDFPELLQKLKEDFKHRDYSMMQSRIQYPVITFLGTGSCIPNKTRNVSSILIQPHINSFILLDCGEGTLGQIQRFFGCKKAEDVIKNLKCIYVSHLHADHHIGLIGLLIERLRLLGNKEDIEKILLLAPKQIEPWLNFYHERISNIKNSYELKGNAELMSEPLYLQTSNADFGIESIKTCLVKHCPHSFGVSITTLGDYNELNKPIKITYSGDTMPCRNLVELGFNSDILIHEATMEDDLIEEAKFKTHSTISQAIEQGERMQAKYTILTHFSQRYAKLPRLQLNSNANSAEELDPAKNVESIVNGTKQMENVSIAFDNMQVSLRDLEHFHLMYPVMRALFAEHADGLEYVAAKREIKLERKRRLLSS